jgi:hypothetical protein
MMIVQSVQCHVVADYTDRTAIQLTWQEKLETSRRDTWQDDWAYRR